MRRFRKEEQCGLALRYYANDCKVHSRIFSALVRRDRISPFAEYCYSREHDGMCVMTTEYFHSYVMNPNTFVFFLLDMRNLDGFWRSFEFVDSGEDVVTGHDKYCRYNRTSPYADSYLYRTFGHWFARTCVMHSYCTHKHVMDSGTFLNLKCSSYEEL